MARIREAEISEDDTFSPHITLKKGGVLTLSGTFEATVTVQRRGTDGSWSDVTSNSGVVFSTANSGTYTISPYVVAADYRFGVKAGEYTSGTVIGSIEGK